MEHTRHKEQNEKSARMTDNLGVLEILDHTHIHNEVHKQLALYKLKDPV